ncbi:MAG: protein sphX [Sphingobacteriaceae bacterium]|nr:protein sphX [Sphingobacteriaceae bacterium]
MRQTLFHLCWNLLAWLSACSLPSARERDNLIRIDGSSSVFPLTEAITEQYYEAKSSHKVVVGVSGTGGGMRKLLRGDIDICNASRPMSASEKQQFEQAGKRILELPVAHDGIVVVAHPQNSWAQNITVSELNRLWRTESQGEATRWSDLRRSWPARPVVLFGAGQSSGTYDFFTQAINGKARSCRGDYSFSENDNILVSGVAGDVHALGYVGFNYYVENSNKLKALGIINDQAGSRTAIWPNDTTIANGSYQPLSRKQYLYVSAEALKRPAVRAFLRYYNQEVRELQQLPGFIPLSAAQYDAWLPLLEEGKVP